MSSGQNFQSQCSHLVMFADCCGSTCIFPRAVSGELGQPTLPAAEPSHEMQQSGPTLDKNQHPVQSVGSPSPRSTSTTLGPNAVSKDRRSSSSSSDDLEPVGHTCVSLSAVTEAYVKNIPAQLSEAVKGRR